MKPFFTLLCLLLLFSCKKERDARYEAICDDCRVWYTDQSFQSGEGAVDVRGHWTVFAIDTVNGIAILDSTYAIGTWVKDVTLEGITPPQVRARNDSGNCTIRMGDKTATTARAGDVIGLY